MLPAGERLATPRHAASRAERVRATGLTCWGATLVCRRVFYAGGTALVGLLAVALVVLASEVPACARVSALHSPSAAQWHCRAPAGARFCGAGSGAGGWLTAHGAWQVTVGPSALEQYEYMQNAGQARFTQLPNYVRCPSPRSQAVRWIRAGRQGSCSRARAGATGLDGRPHARRRRFHLREGGRRGNLTV